MQDNFQKFWRYLKAAFNANLSSSGPGFPPHWLLPFAWLTLGIAGKFSILFPALAVTGLALQLIFLFLVVTSTRFQKAIDGKELLLRQKEKEQEILAAIQSLPRIFQEKYYDLKKRCKLVVEDQVREQSSEQSNVEFIINNLLYVYYRLLKAWADLDRMVKNTDYSTVKSMKQKMISLQKTVADETLSVELKSSYMAQIQILQARLKNQDGAEEKIRYIESECNRIEMQIELVKENAAMSSDSSSVSAQVNAISSGLSATSQWINSQQTSLGQIADDCSEPPNLLSGT